VLQDVGTHCLDLLTWWLGVPTSIAYADDALGGVEANCRVDLRFGDVPATVRLSRDWAQPNRYILTGRDGWLAWTVNEANRFDHGVAGSRFGGALTVHEVATERRQPTLGAVASGFDEAFAHQLRVLVDPGSDPSSGIDGAEALSTLALIDRCYGSATRLQMPWLRPAWDTAP
jgi:predicted dehydrogenase